MKKVKISKVKRGIHQGEFKFRLIAKNGEPIAQSYPESYPRKQSLIKTLNRNFPDFIIIDTTIAKKK